MLDRTIGYKATILADSIAENGVRLTTMEVTFPRSILSEVNTHRVFSRNSASSRAIPVAKQIKKALEHPFIPLQFGVNVPGMQAHEYLTGEEEKRAVKAVLLKRDRQVMGALEDIVGISAIQRYWTRKDYRSFLEKGIAKGDKEKIYSILEEVLQGKGEVKPLHKQTVNRYLEPFLWHTAVISSTEWGNAFALRIHPDAQPEIKLTMEKMKDALEESTPTPLSLGQWHLPFVTEEEKAFINEETIAEWKLISSGRSARVSYETHGGKRDLKADTDLAVRLSKSRHFSPFEHVATPMPEAKFYANFRGWKQFRSEFPGESDFSQYSEEKEVQV